MTGADNSLRARILGAGLLAYRYAPIPSIVKDACVSIAYRLAGPVFRGGRHYELWRHRVDAPPPARTLRDAEGRRRILVVDHYVPQPDRDAGSRSTWCVLRALRSMGLAVTFWPRDLLYDAHYVPMLQAEGIEVIWGEPVRDRFGKWFARHGAAFDYVMLSRPLVARDCIAHVRKHSRAKVLFYGHDLHHARLAREAVLTGFAPLRWESNIMKRIEHAMWRAADVVYYPSSEETEVVRNTVPGVRAHTLPLYFFDDEPPQEEGPGTREGIVFVAGFGHGPNVDAAKWLVREIMPIVWERFPDVHLSLVGSNPSNEVRALAGDKVTVTGYVSDEELLRIYRKARVAVVPLRVGAGMKGKVVEALHHGVPLVTTTVGAQGLQGLSGIAPVSDDTPELATRVISLLEDDAYWRRVSESERAFMGQRFSRQAMCDLLAQDTAIA
jgi:glycosyltransferase involved in cell wall biosynthesis